MFSFSEARPHCCDSWGRGWEHTDEAAATPRALGHLGAFSAIPVSNDRRKQLKLAVTTRLLMKTISLQTKRPTSSQWNDHPEENQFRKGVPSTGNRFPQWWVPEQACLKGPSTKRRYIHPDTVFAVPYSSPSKSVSNWICVNWDLSQTQIRDFRDLYGHEKKFTKPE